MIPDPRNPRPTPESVILDILSKKIKLTTKDLYDFFSKKYKKKITIQGFYKIIKQLINSRILVKDGLLVSIDSSWIHNLLDFSEGLKQTHFREESTLANILIEEGEEKKYTFEKIISMNNFLNHALVTIVHYYYKHDHEDKNIYNYNHHSWSHLIRPSSEKSLAKSYDFMKLKCFLVNGSNTFLDNLTTHNIEYNNYHYYQIKKDKPFPDNYYLFIIGDFILETSLPRYIHDLMENVYSSVLNISKFNSQNITQLINEPARTYLTISRNRKKAKKLRAIISNYYKKMGRT